MVGKNTPHETKMELAISFLIRALRHPASSSEQMYCLGIAVEYLQAAQALEEAP